MIRCIDFHRLEWTHRELKLYYVKLQNGKVFRVWAHDATDAKDMVDDGTVEQYGTILLK